MFAVKAKIFEVHYNQSSSIAFDETPVAYLLSESKCPACGAVTVDAGSDDPVLRFHLVCYP